MIGRGGFACVYRARSLNTGQEVAIKMVGSGSYLLFVFVLTMIFYENKCLEDGYSLLPIKFKIVGFCSHQCFHFTSV